ncbi:MAG: hypothetical protein Kow00114_14610 [Kiloniellaceae bacterium]
MALPSGAAGGMFRPRCSRSLSRPAVCRRSSGVEHTLGKGGVGCSIHPGGTILPGQLTGDPAEGTALEYFAPSLSVLALLISLFTFWFSVIRRGQVRSTHPSFIAFRYDFVGKKHPQAKIFFRSLLYSTGKRGHVVESLFLRVSEGSRKAEFSFWGYGDKDLVRGSGLYVPEAGVATNHHFNPVDPNDFFLLSGGTYSIELVAKLVGQKRLIPLWKVMLEMPAVAYGKSIARETAVFFSWSPEQSRYIASVEKRSEHIHVLSDPAAS